MNASNIHRAATALGATFTAIAALVGATDSSGLGLAPIVWNWVAFGSAVTILVLQGVRQAFDPTPGSDTP